MTNCNRPKFWQKLQFRLPAVFVICLCIFLSLAFYLIQTRARNVLEKREWQNIELSSRAIVEELQQKATVARSLASSMANVASAISPDEKNYLNVFKHLLAGSPGQHLIAGGGVWPEPFLFSPDKERNSFFWGKDQNNELQFFDDYNNAKGNGYHQEAWYVPARYQSTGDVMWSGSYIDPYSLEPMVTCSIPIFKGDQYYGVSTVDLNLSGLDDLVKTWTASFGGYAFVVDRNGKLISKLIKKVTSSVDEFSTLAELTNFEPTFQPLEEASSKLTTTYLHNEANTQFDTTLQDHIAKDSYQISEVEAELISAMIQLPKDYNRNRSYQTYSFKVNAAPFLNEASFISITVMPETLWKVITVMPYSQITTAVGIEIDQLLWPLVIMAVLSIFLIYLFIYFIFIKRVTDITSQLNMNNDSPQSTVEIYTADSGELGLIVNLFNQHTQRLHELTKKLSTSKLGLEKRVEERTKHLQEEVVKREQANVQLEKLSLAVKFSPNSIIITDREGIIEYVNPKFTELTGYAADEALGKWPNLVSSGETDPEVYKQLLKTLLAGNDWRGELHNRKKNGELYWAHEVIAPMLDEHGKVTHFVATEKDITESKRLNELTSYQATHDLLTGLINRYEFDRRLDRLIHTTKIKKSTHALCFIDLDQFKIVNDTCGHVAGDELLRQIGSLLQSHIRQRDTIARLGGDEFAILFEFTDIESANKVCESIIELLEKFRFPWQDKTFTLGASIGLTIINEHIKDSHDALIQVDRACYAAKDAGRNRVQIHSPSNERLKQRNIEFQWSNEINDALDNNRFLLYIQPIISVPKSTQECHYEILLRLQLQNGSIVPPGAFLPAAERYNSATRIDKWVVTHTLQWLSRHADKLEYINSISINLSGQSLGNEILLEHIVKLFNEGDVPTEKITFEITETAAIANLQNATTFISRLKRYGSQFALDDFGSGLSSFAYLKNLQVDVLKIDGMFVKDMLDDPIDAAMVSSINEIGHLMGLKTIAEFVESDEIMERLREIGVDFAQGYALGKPEPINNMHKL